MPDPTYLPGNDPALRASAPLTSVSLSASELTFLWEDCRCCFYNKVVLRMPRPGIPMPAIFNRIDAGMKEFYQPKNTKVIGLPDGSFAYADNWVESVPLTVPGHNTRIVLKGKIDTGLLFADGTGGICDFKTSSPKDHHVRLYSRQLHAYALGVEMPAGRGLHIPVVSRLGLLVFEPITFRQRVDDGNAVRAYFGGGLSWLEIPRDDAAFFAFLGDVLDVLESSVPPPPAKNCAFCAYRGQTATVPVFATAKVGIAS